RISSGNNLANPPRSWQLPATLKREIMNSAKRLIFFVLGFCSAAKLFSAEPPSAGTNTFGFTGPEIFPIDPQIALLHAADIDGDGLTDLIVANNSRSKINILYNQTGSTNKTAARKPGQKREINELPPDA